MTVLTNEELTKKIAEHAKLIEAVSSTIQGYQAYLQETIVELTNHLMKTLDPKIRLIVKAEIENHLKSKAQE